MFNWCIILLILVNLILTIYLYINQNKETYQSEEEDITQEELKEATGEKYEEGPPNIGEKRLKEFEELGGEGYEAKESLDALYDQAQGAEPYDSEYEKEREKLTE